MNPVDAGVQIPRMNRQPVEPNMSARYVLPRPVNVADLSLIARRLFQIVDCSAFEVIHLIAVAKSGYPIATASSMYLSQRFPGKSVLLSGIDIHREINEFSIEASDNTKMLTILIDNSVKTGETAVRSVKMLHELGIRPAIFVKLVRYNDARETAALAYLSAVDDRLEIVSLYDALEISQTSHH